MWLFVNVNQLYNNTISIQRNLISEKKLLYLKLNFLI